jgi:uncharacterized protein (TIGR02217 family)
MAFLETPRFPDNISFGVTGGPEFMTDVVIVDSGQEYRNQVRSLELNRWDVAHAARLPEHWEPLKKFFRVAAGRANGFRFKDWADYEVATGEGVFTLLTATTFQMWKRYTSGATNYDRKIQKPVSGTVTVTGGTLSAVDYTTGIVTMSAGTPTSWTGQFDVPARFDTDQMKGTIIDKSGSSFIIGWESIPIVEIRV